MKLSNFLRWGSRKALAAASSSERRAASDRRRAPRLPAQGAGWIFWADAEGAPQRTRVRFSDIAADGSGLGFTARQPIPPGIVCWAMPDAEGEASPARVRYCEPGETDARIGVSLDFEQRELPGAGAATVRWVDEQGVLVAAPAGLRASGQALLEISLAVDVPAGTPVCLTGASHGCMTICRGSRFEDGRYIIVAEACSESFALSSAAA